MNTNTCSGGPKSLHPVVKATGWVSFFTDLGSELIYPLLPEFITVTLKAPMSLFGLIEGLSEGTPAIVKYFSGAFSDKVSNRKWLVLAGYSLSSIVKPLIGLTKYLVLGLAPFIVLILRMLDRIGKGIRGAPRDAIVADYSEGVHGRAFGYQRAMDHAGAVAGGISAFVLIAWLRLDIVWAVFLSFIPGILAVLIIILFVHDIRPRISGETDSREHSKTLKKDTPPLGSIFYLYLVSAVLFALANSSDAFLLIRAKELGITVAYLPLIWALLHLVKAVTSLIGGILSDRMGRKPLLIFGWFLYSAVYIGFSWLTGGIYVWVLFAVYGAFFGATEGVAKAFVADIIPAGSRGRAFGVLGMVEGLMLIPSSIFTGWLWERMGSGHIPLLINAVFALFAAIWLILFVRLKHRPANT